MSFADQTPDTIDVPFSIPAVHRLRFTRDLFGDDQRVLTDVLESSDGKPARVQFWVDSNVLEAQPKLVQRIKDFCSAHPNRVERVGNVQIVPGGEEVKNDIHILERMLKVMHAAELDRRSYVVVIGGGAVLDAVGFAAAIAHRGIRLVRLPTTTLAQADSAIGVKNSVNLFAASGGLVTRGSYPHGVVCPQGRAYGPPPSPGSPPRSRPPIEKEPGGRA